MRVREAGVITIKNKQNKQNVNHTQHIRKRIAVGPRPQVVKKKGTKLIMMMKLLLGFQ